MNYDDDCVFFLEFSNKIYGDDELRYQKNLICFFGVFVLIFAIIILYLVGNPGYQRPPDNQIEHVPLAD
jgi:hypothetical protein